MNVFRYLTDREFRFNLNDRNGRYDYLSDEEYLKKSFKVHMKYNLDLVNPRTYNEKLQWLKLHDRNPVYTVMVDKCEMKAFVSAKIGDGHVVPLLGVWDSFEDIPIDRLPDRFVLKCTHNSGGMVVCKDKAAFDVYKAGAIIEKSLKTDYFMHSREWPYKNVIPRIIAEEYLAENDTGCLTDYKFFCFNGIPKIVYVSNDNAENPSTDFFDENFNPIDMRMRDPNSEIKPHKPDNFDEMIHYAKKLSENIPHIRVDFYEVNDVVYVGELTFYHCAGMVEPKPEKWSYIMGDWIDLSLAFDNNHPADTEAGNV